ncbi:MULTISPECIES: GlxA family transcriptional regulator [Mucilaginibacter]|jgi:transcriptional regulator GlxA family with amidase domain|uniref:Transcriptional regulator GlxA family, contains an amidase domain and an AraC-type DNA-binding HTH domain n=1 Tax=Mucilaginibacter gossypii TaxID=551996 RepID=A0A1G7PVM4_9SPHI|nr:MULTISPECIES: helix-turn-helix domain-containing protein [Mucilaginibacter]WEA02122.1 helix-turn-helix domain-containing protein [Mucilaginibacter sp. SJ]GGA93260.1 AraC family transcriptional regulator [Mucilaginibacter rubeus]SCW46717.1 Transcriptional regulator GlxA family, contains an amidase domain and an AraC-type DNA-binding HTH domain [Mucilaginibacter sp. NFR10]SDF90324.1 Transcriptional regulator GlxA family, contains an amidase domain and an AraC-type DNA-binding HTH domain [Mucil
MKHVAILIPNEAVLASIVDARTIFTGANDFLQSMGRQPVFDVQMVGLSKEVKVHGGMFSVHTDILLSDLQKSDMVIIPAISGDLQNAVNVNRDFVPWIINQYNNGAEIASLCIGSFILASTGLLNGKECSSHWITADAFRNMFPEVKLVDGRIVTEQQGLYSSGGATSYWSLLLLLIEKYAGRDIAIMAAKIYALEIDRKSQSPFAMFTGQKKHEDNPIKQAQEYIENNVTEKISVEDLSSMYAIGRRHFERRFKKATNNTPVEYIQRVKIEAAKKQLESTPKNINEVMYDVGYTDAKAFRTVFKKITGLSPIDYRNKYNKEAAVA